MDIKQQYPKISIITVNYNKGNFIEETIQSVILQNYPNLEYIIIDGGSTDQSVEIIQKYKTHLAYFVSEPDNGMTDALIKGFSKATGEILAWINSDDSYLPGTFHYVASLYQKKKFDFLYADCILTDVNNKPILRSKSYYTTYKAQAWGIIPIYQPSCFWSKHIFEKIKGLDPCFHVTMDGDLFYRILKNTRSVIRKNRPLATFRIHPNQSGSWAPKGKYQEERKILFDREIISNNFFKVYSYFFKISSYFLRLLGIK